LIIQNIATEQVPEISREDGVKIRLIAGEVDGLRGPVTDIFADPAHMDVSIPANGSFSYPIERGHKVFAYVFEGEGVFGADGGQKGETVTHPRLAVLSDTGFFEARATAPYVRFLLISGKPLKEPIARYGPFVMNTQDEIQQALKDLKNGTFVQN
jgi:redox-sensitive bicupin YhaK (pirin superfamily)